MIRKVLVIVALLVCTVLPTSVKAGAGVAPTQNVYVVQQTRNYFKIDWSTWVNVDGYEVYRCTTMKGDDFKKIADIPRRMESHYYGKNSQGRSCRYRVKAYKNTNKGRIYSDLYREVIVSTKVVELKTIGDYILKHGYINYHFYNLGKREGYQLRVDPRYNNSYGIIQQMYKAKKDGTAWGDRREYVIDVDRVEE